jgi:hypothetical protein
MMGSMAAVIRLLSLPVGGRRPPEELAVLTTECSARQVSVEERDGAFIVYAPLMLDIYLTVPTVRKVVEKHVKYCAANIAEMLRMAVREIGWQELDGARREARYYAVVECPQGRRNL